MNTGPSIALTNCFYCGEAGTIVMSRRVSYRDKKVEEMNGKVIDMTPCSKCEEYMKKGIILITFDPSKSDPQWYKEKMPNPYRTGGFFVIKEEALSRFINDQKLIDWAKKVRWMFIEHEAAEKLGLFEAVE